MSSVCYEKRVEVDSRKSELKRECNSRESNPGLIRGRDLSYHLTTIALFCLLTHLFSEGHSHSPYRLSIPMHPVQKRSTLLVLLLTLFVIGFTTSSMCVVLYS